MSNRLADLLRNEGVVEREPITLRGGEVSEYYVDVKKAYGNPAILRYMASLICKKLDPDTTCIAASGHGGISLGTAIALQSEHRLTSVRDVPKNHGRGGLIDGYVPGMHDVVTIVDDVFTTGSSLRQTIKNLGKVGRIAGCHVAVARGDVSEFELPVGYLLRADDIL